jgi:hypothetical protein
VSANATKPRLLRTCRPVDRPTSCNCHRAAAVAVVAASSTETPRRCSRRRCICQPTAEPARDDFTVSPFRIGLEQRRIAASPSCPTVGPAGWLPPPAAGALVRRDSQAPTARRDCWFTVFSATAGPLRSCMPGPPPPKTKRLHGINAGDKDRTLRYGDGLKN